MTVVSVENVGRTKINLVTSNKLYYFLFITFHSLLRHCIQKENQRGVSLKK